MKKVLFVLITLGVSLVSCHKNSETPTFTIATNIIGKWREGGAVIIYYSGGKEVYRESTPANDGVSSYTEFKANNVFTDYTLITAGEYTGSDGTYSIINNNTLRISIQNQSQDYTITMPDINNINISAMATGSIGYYKSGQMFTADSEMVNGTLIRL